MNLSSVADVTTSVYDFSGKTVASREVHVPGNSLANITVDKWFDYDHADRLTNTWQQNSRTLSGTTTTDAKILFSQVKYNDLGQVVEKNLHSESQDATALQSVDYTYNIRGWKTHINNSTLNTSATNNNDDSNDLFGMELLYQNTTAGVTTSQQYNGSISVMLWKTNTPSAAPLKAYVYNYDNLDRLTNASYKEYSGGTWSNTDKFRESVSGYDLNGNIKYLQRWNSSAQQIDNLTYYYTNPYPSGNTLASVSDAATTAGGYRDFAASDTENSYDANGNLISNGDARSTITYNHLNLPTVISLYGGKTINYVYDAVGNKIRQYSNFGGCQGTTHYKDGYFYRSTDCDATTPTSLVFTYFSTAEGRVTNTGTSYSYEYILKDHLGNSRVMFDKDPLTKRARVLQEDNYYAFGLKQGPSLVWSGSSTGGNKYLFNGKEILDEADGSGIALYYEYGARMYDPILARWVVLDPLAEMAYTESPYCYVGNDPVNCTDPTGQIKFKLPFKAIGNFISNVAEKALPIIKAVAPIVVGIVVGAVVTVATGGLGGPVVGAILIGALSGAAGAAASNVTSQVISNKGFNNFDFGSLGKDVLIGAAIEGAFAGAGEGIKAIKNAKSFNRMKALGEMKPVTPKGVQPLPSQGVNLPTPKQVNIPKPPAGSIQVGQAIHTQADDIIG